MGEALPICCSTRTLAPRQPLMSSSSQLKLGARDKFCVSKWHVHEAWEREGGRSGCGGGGGVDLMKY
ncbi:hypothetical protein J6590_024003 [Homalodisca vitripennis]|nr:hypothetical protein J6590_024003 [Homalodisca vitripennis]